MDEKITPSSLATPKPKRQSSGRWYVPPMYRVDAKPDAAATSEPAFVRLRERRRSSRFDLRLTISVRRANVPGWQPIGETMNLSSTGVLFTTEQQLEFRKHLSFRVILGEDDKEVTIADCAGTVLRIEPMWSGYAVAASIERKRLVRVLRSRVPEAVVGQAAS